MNGKVKEVPSSINNKIAAIEHYLDEISDLLKVEVREDDDFDIWDKVEIGNLETAIYTCRVIAAHADAMHIRLVDKWMERFDATKKGVLGG